MLRDIPVIFLQFSSEMYWYVIIGVVLFFGPLMDRSRTEKDPLQLSIQKKGKLFICFQTFHFNASLLTLMRNNLHGPPSRRGRGKEDGAKRTKEDHPVDPALMVIGDVRDPIDAGISRTLGEPHVLCLVEPMGIVYTLVDEGFAARPHTVLFFFLVLSSSRILVSLNKAGYPCVIGSVDGFFTGPHTPLSLDDNSSASCHDVEGMSCIATPSSPLRRIAVLDT